MEFWHSIGGMTDVELTSADPEKLLDKLNAEGIELYSLRLKNELSCLFRIKRGDYRKAEQICQNNDGEFRVIRRTGLYWKAKRLLHRPVLVCGFAGLLALVLLLPTRVLFVKVEGNSTVPANRILEEANQCGIRFGASRREVRSEKVKNALIDAVPELQWAGINTKGCVAIITVRERTLRPAEQNRYSVSSIVAQRDGYVLSATATRGSLLVQPGQTVRSGQVLISGYSDLGLCIQADSAEGEIIAQTMHQVQAVTPTAWTQQQENGINKKKISMIVGKKRINLWKDSGISGSTCGRMYEECYITLPGNYQLPVAVCVETYLLYDCKEAVMEQPYSDGAMDSFLQKYLLDQTVAGKIIRSSSEQSFRNGAFFLELNCICHEMIGRVRQEQIGDTNE